MFLNTIPVVSYGFPNLGHSRVRLVIFTACLRPSITTITLRQGARPVAGAVKARSMAQRGSVCWAATTNWAISTGWVSGCCGFCGLTPWDSMKQLSQRPEDHPADSWCTKAWYLTRRHRKSNQSQLFQFGMSLMLDRKDVAPVAVPIINKPRCSTFHLNISEPSGGHL